MPYDPNFFKQCRISQMILAGLYLFTVCFMVLVLIGITGCDTDCDESEKVLSHYETRTYGDVTFTEPVMRCE